MPPPLRVVLGIATLPLKGNTQTHTPLPQLFYISLTSWLSMGPRISRWLMSKYYNRGRDLGT